MLRAIRGCLSGGRYRAGGRAWAEAAHRCHQKSQRAPCQKSSKLEAPPLGDNSPVCAADSWLLVPVRIALSSLFSSRFRLAQFYRHTPLAGSRRRCMGFSLIQSSLQAELLLRYVTFRYVTFRYVTLRSPSAKVTSVRYAPLAMPYTHGAPRRVLGGAASRGGGSRAPARSCSSREHRVTPFFAFGGSTTRPSSALRRAARRLGKFDLDYVTLRNYA